MLNAAKHPTTAPLSGLDGTGAFELSELVKLVSEQLDFHDPCAGGRVSVQPAEQVETASQLADSRGGRFIATLSATEAEDAMPVRGVRLEMHAADAADALLQTLQTASNWLAGLAEVTVTLQREG